MMTATDRGAARRATLIAPEAPGRFVPPDPPPAVISLRGGTSMTLKELDAEIRYVLAGHDGYEAIGFPTSGELHNVLYFWSDMFISLGKFDAAQTRAYIRKLAVYLIRNSDHTYCTINHATAWFTSEPHRLLTPLSMAGALRSYTHAVEAITRPPIVRLADMLDADMALPRPDPGMLWRDGPWEMAELIHARHLVEVGKEAANCLVQARSGKCFPHPEYWLGIKRKALTLCTLRYGPTLCAIFCAHKTKLRDCQVFSRPDGYDDAINACAGVLEHRIGFVNRRMLVAGIRPKVQHGFPAAWTRKVSHDT